MSTRNIKKLRERLQKDKKEEEPLEEFEPSFQKKRESAFSLLTLSSESEQEKQNSDDDSDDLRNQPAPTSKNIKKRNKKKKKKNKENSKPGPSQIEKSDDEIDRVVAEVNMILGEPAPASVCDNVDSNKTEEKNTLRVIAKFINADNEMVRLFGPADDDEDRRVRRQRPQRITKRLLVQPKLNYTFSLKGIRMTMIQEKNDIKYFKFEHSQEYYNHMKLLIAGLNRKYFQLGVHEAHIFPVDTVETTVENNDVFYNMEDIEMGRPTIEEVIHFIQTIFHPKFNICDMNCRLEYKYVENRTFHVILLKYLHLLTNKVCHRTALEVAKLLLNLDPTDPLAVILIIDTLALRAREHLWLTQLYDMWKDERGAKRLFHMRYSNAMALFHVATKNKDEELMMQANKEIRSAILEFPYVVVKLAECASQKINAIGECDLFNVANKLTPKELKELIFMYTTFIWPRWREPNVWKWFSSIVTDFVNDYNGSEELQKQGAEFALRCPAMYRSYPLEIRRHLNTISPMSQLIADGAVPHVTRTVSFNPYPELGECIDSRSYFSSWGNRGPETVNNGLFRTFFTSIVPQVQDRGNQQNNVDYQYEVVIVDGQPQLRVVEDDDSEDEDYRAVYHNPENFN